MQGSNARPAAYPNRNHRYTVNARLSMTHKEIAMAGRKNERDLQPQQHKSRTINWKWMVVMAVLVIAVVLYVFSYTPTYK
jgi:heme/copper-type cytochrome/quinol oxidase subunit 2